MLARIINSLETSNNMRNLEQILNDCLTCETSHFYEVFYMKERKYIKIKGANEHNLKNVSLDIPRDEFVVLTGLSGSGKSSLAFDTIFAEGQRRYMESLSSYARQFLGQMESLM